MTAQRKRALSQESRRRFFDLGIVLMVFAAIAKTVPLIAVIYAYSKLSMPDDAVARFSAGEHAFLEGLMIYGSMALIGFLAVFVSGAALLAAQSRRQYN